MRAAAVAEPMLASAIYSTLTRGTKTDHQGINGQEDGRRRVLTGCAAIDEALGTGLAYGHGGICCISGDEGSGVDEIAQSLLISHLLSQASATATIVDTRGTFDVRKLHRGLVSRLQVSSGVPDGETSSSSSAERAGRILGRVKLMRVFDVDGLLEGVAEMKEDLGRVSEGQSEGGSGEEEMVSRVKSTIADSQGDDEEEMLDDLPPAEASSEALPKAEHEGQGDSNLGLEKKCHMLVIDNLTQVMSPMIKSDYVQGHALLTTFLRSLGHTARQHNMGVVLLNTVLTYKEQHDGPSAFSSIVGRPGIGKTLSYMVDTHLFVNRLPKTQRDMKIAYPEGDDRKGIRSGNTGRVQWVNVVEVLQDRGDDRVGRVGLFTIDNAGCVTKAF